MKEFKNITLSIPEELFELTFATLMDFSTLGIREDYDKLIITFESANWNDEIKNELLNAIKSFYPDVEILNEELILAQNWNEEWERNVPIIQISDKVAITPKWKKHEIDVELPIIINPKMSFGTGQHETTRLICRLMEEYVLPDELWVDAGTGTGVLAILAAKLGAKKVFAFDNNSWAVENTSENIILNSVESIINVAESDIDDYAFPTCNGIAANLYANLILSSLDKFYNSLKENKGKLLVSGILVYDEAEIIQKALSSGFRLIKKVQEAEWIALAFQA
jgi:ribosomal protein L11 methyltransferase